MENLFSDIESPNETSQMNDSISSLEEVMYFDSATNKTPFFLFKISFSFKFPMISIRIKDQKKPSRWKLKYMPK